MQIGELKVRLGVDADTFKVKDFAHALGQIPFTVAAGITALTGMSFAFTDLLKNTLGLANNLSIFTTTTGQSATELERWTGVAKQMGLGADAVQSSVQGIVLTFAQLRATGTFDENFMRGMAALHVKMDQNDPFGMLRQALVNANGMRDKSFASQALSMMGIDPSLISLGALSQKQFERMGNRGVILDNEGIKAMKDFQVQLSSFELTLEKSFIPVMMLAIPVMGKLADSIGDLIKELGPLLVHGTVREVSNVANIVGLVKAGTQWKDVIEGFSKGLEYRPRGGWGGTTATGQMNITNHIHSTADPEAVANVVNEFTQRYHRKAISVFNNGGR